MSDKMLDTSFEEYLKSHLHDQMKKEKGCKRIRKKRAKASLKRLWRPLSMARPISRRLSYAEIARQVIFVQPLSEETMSNETNPIIFFCSCEDCGAKAGEECNDSCYKNSRLNHFIECAPLRDRMRAMSWLYLTLPQWLKKDTMDEGPKSGTLYLSREEFMIWKKLNAAGVAK
jgi:hypothetical protein